MKNHSLFMKFFIVLTLFIIIPVIIIATLLSYRIINFSENEISKSAISSLRVAENLNELITDTLHKQALEISTSNAVNDLNGLYNYEEIFSTTEDIMKLSTAQDLLLNLVRTNDILHSMYLYMDDSDYILTSNQGVIDLNDFADTGWVEAYNRYKETKAGPVWLPTRTFRYSMSGTLGEMGASNKVITSFYTLTPYIARVKGVLVFNFYEEAIRKLINSKSSISDGYIEIVNADGEVITHVEPQLIGTNIIDTPYIRQIINSPEKEGYIIDNTEHKRLLISYNKSDFNNWIYIGVFTVDNLMAKVNALKTYTIYICLICMLIGTLLSYIISKRIYSPLNKLVQEIKARKGIDIKSNENEMSILSKALDSLFKQEAKLFDILERNSASIRDAFILRLLQGKISEGIDRDLTGIDFIHPHYVCAVLSIDRDSVFESNYTEEQQSYMKMLILKVSEELLNTTYRCAGTIYEKNRVALIINYDFNSSSDMELELRSHFSKINEEILKVFDFTISMGVGDCQETVSGIRLSLDRAQEALKYKLIGGYGSIHFWHEINMEDAQYYYPFSHEKYIFNILNTGDREKLEEVITGLIQEIKANREIQYDNVVQVFNQLIGNTVKYLLDLHCNIGMIFGNNYNVYHILSTKKTLDDIKFWLVDLYTTIADYLSQSRIMDKSYYKLALDYIHKNYKNEIDISVIAEYAGLSYSHLRKIFKEETGENMINYINNLRVSESKRLLCQTNLTVKEIAGHLGYNNDQSFTRFFKKYEGISPGEFRLSHKAQEVLPKESVNTN